MVKPRQLSLAGRGIIKGTTLGVYDLNRGNLKYFLSFPLDGCGYDPIL
jgi:hypothetical protein